MVACHAVWVGWDAEPDAVRAVALTDGPSGALVQAVMVQELPHAPAEAQASGRASWIATVLAELPSRALHATISGPDVAARRLRLPPMAAGELAEAARWQLKEQVAFPVEGAHVSVKPLGDVWEKDLKKLDVLAVIASQAATAQRRAAIEAAGGKVVSFMPRELALAHAVAVLMPPARTGSVAIIDVGSDRTQVVVMQEGRLQLARDVAIGESTLVGALVGVVASESGELTIDAGQARAILRQYGLLADGVDGATETGVPLFHLASLMRPSLERLVTELSRVLDFYRLQVDDAGASRVVLCGSGAAVAGLAGFLREHLGMPTDVFDPFVTLPRAPGVPALSAPGSALVAALGAALAHGELGNVAPHRPAGAPWVAAWQRVVRIAALAGLAACGMLALAWLIVTLQLLGQRSAFRAIEPAYREAQALTQRRAQAESQVAQAHQLLARQPAFEGIWKELGSLVPARMRLDELRIEARDAAQGAFSFRLAGHVTDAAGAGLADLVDALEASPYFVGVSLAGAELRSGTESAHRFTLEGELE